MALVSMIAMGCTAGDPVDIGEGTESGQEQPVTEESVSDTEAGGGVLRAALMGEVPRLDPHLSLSFRALIVFEQIYETLVRLDENGEFQPLLAEDWETSDDGLLWTFHLQDGVQSHNGRAMTADDVVFSFERILDPEVGSGAADNLAHVEDIRAVDDLTVEIELSQPRGDLLYGLGRNKSSAIIPREVVEEGSIDTNPVGTGPFRFVEVDAGGSLVLERNPDYWQEGIPLLDGVVFNQNPDPEAEFSNLIGGEVDFIAEIPPERFEEAEANDDIEVDPSVTVNDTWYLMINKNREPFDDLNVRRAMAYAIDHDAITQAAMFGKATPNWTGIPSDNEWYHDYAPFEHDPERAIELLAESGLEDGFDMEILLASDFPHTVRAAGVMQDQLEEVGISVELRQVDFATELSEMGEGNFDTLLLGWLGGHDPHSVYQAHHTSEGSLNAHGYNNEEVDSLFAEARAEEDFDQRKALYDQATEIFVDEVSYIYLYNPHALDAWRSEVEGFVMRPDRATSFWNVQLGD